MLFTLNLKHGIREKQNATTKAGSWNGKSGDLSMKINLARTGIELLMRGRIEAKKLLQLRKGLGSSEPITN
jgi:hypothetical protein